jgi:hypothetical protein
VHTSAGCPLDIPVGKAGRRADVRTGGTRPAEGIALDRFFYGKLVLGKGGPVQPPREPAFGVLPIVQGSAEHVSHHSLPS